ncbi:hypothetical protein M9H77_23402 [Catharanthus roseus]|uniref:Uncharacterized protein n=1 Tax=Catharanthus roseus TaxID=4058 RepID=A0ACC0AVE2_CATRO|nr:hypothetical protein M9H77_23402 [Catharanthus roseus]
MDPDPNPDPDSLGIKFMDPDLTLQDLGCIWVWVSSYPTRTNLIESIWTWVWVQVRGYKLLILSAINGYRTAGVQKISNLYISRSGVPACDICHILGENPDFYNPFPLEIACSVSYHVPFLCLEYRVLNYKKHPSKSSHSRPDENSLGKFFCMFVANISPAHKYLFLTYFLYTLQEHENKATYMFAIFRNYLIYYLAVVYRRCCPYQKPRLEI